MSKYRLLTPAELDALRADMRQASAWMQAELRRRRAAKLQATPRPNLPTTSQAALPP